MKYKLAKAGLLDWISKNKVRYFNNKPKASKRPKSIANYVNYITHGMAVIQHHTETSCRPCKLILTDMPVIKRKKYFKVIHYKQSAYKCAYCGWESEIITEKIN